MPLGGDVIELVHEQTYLGQTVNNVYFFEAAVAEASMSDLANWFETNVVTKVKLLQNDLVNHVNLRLRNLFNEAETLEEPLTGTGTITSSDIELPSFIASQVRLEHASGAVRPGFKRYTGMTEGSLTDGLLNITPISKLEDIADLLVNPPVVANSGWAHVIVGRLCEVPNPTPNEVPACLKYRLPQNQAELVVAYPIAYTVYAQITSQNSRKWYT